MVMDAESLGDGGAGNVGIEDGHVVTFAAHGHGQLAGDHGLAHAALTGDNAVDFAYAATLMEGLFLKYILALAAVLAAAAAIVIALAHSWFLLI